MKIENVATLALAHSIVISTIGGWILKATNYKHGNELLYLGIVQFEVFMITMLIAATISYRRHKRRQSVN